MEGVNKKQKRKRSENWGSSDKSLLKDLCVEVIKIIEDKTVDTNTNKRKREEWNQIMFSYNSVCEVKRDVAQLQFQWRAMKQRAKQACSEYRREKARTGGGPPPLSPKREDGEMMELIPKEFEIDSNQFDSDGCGWILKNPKDEDNDGAVGYVSNEVDHNTENVYPHDMSATSATGETQNHIVYSVEGIDEYDENNNPPVACSTPKTANKERKPRGKKKSTLLSTESEFKRDLYELTRKNIIREHEERMSIMQIEKECRKLELDNIKRLS